MRKYLNLFLICVCLFSYVVSLPDVWNETESLLIGKAMEDPCSCTENCYFTMKPLLKYASECHKKDMEICNLKLTIRKQNEKLHKQNEREKHFNITKTAEIGECDSKIANLKTELETQLENNSKTIEKLNVKNESGNVLKNLREQLQKSGEDLQNARTQLDDNSKTIAYLNRINEDNSITIQNLRKINEIQKTESDSALKNLEQQLEKSGQELRTTQGVCKSAVSGSRWIIIQRRFNSNVDFNRTWEEYKSGFGDFNSSFFIGLEHLHLLTRTEIYELYILLVDKNNGTKYAQYDNFIVGSENEGYQLKSVGQHSGTAVDSLSHLVTMNFTTIDRDNDLWSNGNCAKLFNGGWWFQSCAYSCLNGNYKIDAEQSLHLNPQGNHHHNVHHHFDGHLHSGQHHFRHHHHGPQHSGHHNRHNYFRLHHYHERHAGHRMIWDDQTVSFAQMMIRVKM